MKVERRAGLRQAFLWGGALLLGTGYSVVSHLAATSTTPTVLGALVAIFPLLGLAFVMAWRSALRAVMLTVFLAGCAGLYGASDWLIAHYNWVFLLQHAGMYALLCMAFGRTLQSGRTPMITGFARMVHSSLSPALLDYTRCATWAWSLYFASMSGLSVLLFWLAPVPVWSAFANLLGGPLLVLMFAGEYAARCYFLPAAERAGPLEAIRAYRQASSSGPAHRP